MTHEAKEDVREDMLTKPGIFCAKQGEYLNVKGDDNNVIKNILAGVK